MSDHCGAVLSQKTQRNTKKVYRADQESMIRQGIEAMHMIKKGQVECNHSSPLFVVQLIHQLFGLTASKLGLTERSAGSI
ncbi:hypothetical protein GC096_08105 [Paenibacillus sp. LMG 31461]|uniref:Transposase n=1 Tax=Paenibacillus plantarum TaxID=2654975 RepID=A0ABX1X6F1_9BACL|nr:hypothetical protein [Paenibacillus plantarum]NOU63987.1 hypothetical protein [Paenibacillus plantarum]